jgi:hypothetical protein
MAKGKTKRRRYEYRAKENQAAGVLKERLIGILITEDSLSLKKCKACETTNLMGGSREAFLLRMKQKPSKRRGGGQKCSLTGPWSGNSPPS